MLGAAGHRHVQQHEARAELARQPEGLVGVAGLRDDVQVVLLLEEVPKPRAYERMVVGEHDRDRVERDVGRVHHGSADCNPSQPSRRCALAAVKAVRLRSAHGTVRASPARCSGPAVQRPREGAGAPRTGRAHANRGARA